MKSSETAILTFLGVVLCSFFFGLGQRHTLAAPINNCTSSCCEEIYSWWISGVPGGNQAYSAQTLTAGWPFKQGDNVNNAIPGIFVDAPSKGGCKYVKTGTFNRWIWPSCSAGCAPDKLGLSPSPQRVTPSSTPSADPGNPINLYECQN